jgi:hypothetical protein
MKQTLLLFSFLCLGFFASGQAHAKADLTVYPNPVTDYISVQDNHDAVGQVLVFSLVGRRVKTFDHVKGEQYYVADLPKGMYLVQLVDKNQRILTTHKLEKR